MNNSKVVYGVLNLTTDKDSYPTYYLLEPINPNDIKQFNFPEGNIDNRLFPDKDAPEVVGEVD